MGFFDRLKTDYGGGQLGPLASQTPATARQQMMFTPAGEEKWYSGRYPTAAETGAQIAAITKSDPARGRQMWDAFQMYSSTPGNPLYNPYQQATNPAIGELSALGYDMSAGVGQGWLDQHAGLMANYRTGASGTPLAPSSKSTPAQNAAYWYYKTAKAEEPTQRAEMQWDALKEELTYWVGRTDRNYSDEQIYDRINWKDYPDLVAMDEARELGVPIQLNRPIGYSQDAVWATMWQARGNQTTGNPYLDAVKARMHAGEAWQENEAITAKLDPTSDQYSPYSVGSTMDDAALYFNVGSFAPNWLEENRGILAGTDETAKGMYSRVAQAEKFTQQVEAERDELYAMADEMLSYYSDPDSIIATLSEADGFSGLHRMDESLRSGKLIPTTRAVDYRWQDVESYVRDKCAQRNGGSSTRDFAQDVGVSLGMPGAGLPSQTGEGIDAAQQGALNAAAPTIMALGTEPEKELWRTGSPVDMEKYVANIHTALDKGTTPPKASYYAAMTNVDAFATENWFGAMTDIREAKRTNEALAEAEAQLTKAKQAAIDTNHSGETASKPFSVKGKDYELSAQWNPETKSYDVSVLDVEGGYSAPLKGNSDGMLDALGVPLSDEWLDAYDDMTAWASQLSTPTAAGREEVDGQILELQQTIQELQGKKEEQAAGLEAGLETMYQIGQGYDAANRVAKAVGLEGLPSVLPTMVDLFNISLYVPQYTTTSLYDLAASAGMPPEEVQAAAAKGIEQRNLLLQRLEWSRQVLADRGIQLPEEFTQEIDRAKCGLENEIKDAEYYKLRSQPDFGAVANDTLAAVEKAYAPNSGKMGYTLNVLGHEVVNTYGYSQEAYSVMLGHMLNQRPENKGQAPTTVGEGGLPVLMSDAEVQTYMYLLGSKGQEAASEYLAHLTDDEYGDLHTRNYYNTQAQLEGAADDTKSAILNNLYTHLISPLSVMGTAYAIGAKAQGKELNPYNVNFSVSNQTELIRGSTREEIEKLSGDFASVATLLYDAGTSAIDSGINYGLMAGLGLAGGAAGAAAKTTLGKVAAKFGQEFMMAAPMGLQSLSGVAQDLAARGANDEQFWSMMGINFLSETLTEAITVGNIKEAFGAGKEAKNAFVAVLKDMFVEEGTGEGVAEFVESWSDKQIMGLKSNWEAQAQAYEKQGMGRELAERQATSDMWGGVFYAYLTGAVSAGLSSGASSTLGFFLNPGQRKAAAQIDPRLALEQELYLAGNLPAHEMELGMTQAQVEAQYDANIADAAHLIQEENTPDTMTPGMLEEEAPAQQQEEAPAQQQEEAPAQQQEEAPAEQQREEAPAEQQREEAPAKNPPTIPEPVPFEGEALPDDFESDVRRDPTYSEVHPVEDRTDPNWPRIPTYIKQRWAGRVVSALSSAIRPQGYNPSNAVAAVAAALAPSKATARMAAMATTAAEKLVAHFGTRGVAALRTAFAMGAEQSVDNKGKAWQTNGFTTEQVQNAFTTAAFDAETGAALAELTKPGGTTPANVKALIDTAAKAESNPAMLEKQSQEVIDNAVAHAVQKRIANGALEGVTGYETALANAKKRQQDAKAGLRKVKSIYQAKLDMLATIKEQYLKNPADQMLRGQMQQALNDVSGAAKVVDEYTQSVSNAVSDTTQAIRTLQEKRMNAMRTIRQEEQANVIASLTRAPEAEVQPATTEQAIDQNLTDKQPVQQEAAAQQEAPVAASIAKAPEQAATTEQAIDQNLADKQPAQQAQSVARSIDKEPVRKPRHLRSSYQIAKEMARALDVGDAIGESHMPNMEPGVLGYYQNEASYIVTRPTTAGDHEVAFHEIFHALQHKLGMEGNQQAIDNLPEEFKANYNPAALPGEAFAEFGWRYMQDENLAREFAGDEFVDDFQQKLREAKLDKTVDKYAKQLRRYLQASTTERVQATIHARSESEKAPIGKRIENTITHMVDYSAPAGKVDQFVKKHGGERVDLRNNILMLNYSKQRAYGDLMDGLTDGNWNVVGESLAAGFERVGFQAKDEKLLAAYLTEMTTLDRMARDIKSMDSSFTEEDLRKDVARIKREHPEVAEAAKVFWAFQHNFLQEKLVNTGMLPQATLDRIEKENPHHASMMRTNKKGHADGIERATGSTADTYNPIDSLVELVVAVENKVARNKAALAFSKAYRANKGMGAFGRDVTQEIRASSVGLEALKNEISHILENVMDEAGRKRISDLIDSAKEMYEQGPEGKNPIREIIELTVGQEIGPGKAMDLVREALDRAEHRGRGNVITATYENGDQYYYEIQDPEMYQMFMGSRDGGAKAFQMIGQFTRTMTMLTTGSNPFFSLKNLLRDFQNSVNHGSWASNYLTGAVKWGIAFYNYWANTAAAQEYNALGGGGMTSVNPNNLKSRSELMRSLLPKYDRGTVGRRARGVGHGLWEVATFAKFNEVVEQTSRFAEYMFGKHDKTTQQGRVEAFVASQDATVDFGRRGNAQLATILKQTCPFLGAATQGIYRNIRDFSPAEMSRLPARMAKTVVNVGLSALIEAAILLKFLPDRDREEYLRMPAFEKVNNFFFPNFAPEVFGPVSLIKIPLPEDPYSKVFRAATQNAAWGLSTDDPMPIEWMDLANQILDDMNLLGSNIFTPFFDVARNLTWFDSPIENAQLQRKPNVANRFREDTPQIFRDLARLPLMEKLGLSPVKIQYLFQQYTGVLGQVFIPAASLDKDGKPMGVWKALVSKFRRTWTTDPTITTDLLTDFYGGQDLLNGVWRDAKNGDPMVTVRRGLPKEDYPKAAREAYALTHKGGIVYWAQQQINEAYDRIDAIERTEGLSDDQKYLLVREERRAMQDAVLRAQEAIGAFKAKYILGDNFVIHALLPGETLTPKKK